jgi:hypothetical protein
MGVDVSESFSVDLSENKKYYLQVVIVKLLKAHQSLSPVRLSQLVNEESVKPGPVSFRPTQVQLDMVLEQLMEKQYIEHDTRQDVYVYMP